ncbi:MAG: nuclear transport factor 2 family protein [Acidobacteriota bacterium]
MATRKDPGLEKRIERFNSTYEKGTDYFENFAEDASIYTIGSTEPFKGRAAYEANFKKLLKEKRKVDVLKSDVQVMDETAVLMQLLEITQSQVVTVLRQSTIWKKENGDWKVVHLHCASVGTPRPTAAQRNPQAIKVLADRIATVSAQVGVAQ